MLVIRIHNLEKRVYFHRRIFANPTRRVANAKANTMTAAALLVKMHLANRNTNINLCHLPPRLKRGWVEGGRNGWIGEEGLGWGGGGVCSIAGILAIIQISFCIGWNLKTETAGAGTSRLRLSVKAETAGAGALRQTLPGALNWRRSINPFSSKPLPRTEP